MNCPEKNIDRLEERMVDSIRQIHVSEIRIFRFANRFITGLLLFTLAILSISCRSSVEKAEQQMVGIISEYESNMIPLEKNLKQARWNYASTGEPAYLLIGDSLQWERIDLMSDSKTFQKLKELKESGYVKDEYLSRQLDILYKEYLVYQVDRELLLHIISLDSYLRNLVWQKLSEERTQAAEKVLRSSSRDTDLMNAWSYVKESGTIIKDSLLELVRLRNELARQVGFDDFFQLKIYLDDLRPTYVDSVIQTLTRETQDAYMKIVSDVKLAVKQRHWLQDTIIRPWHMRGRFLQYGWRANSAKRDMYYSYVSMVDVVNRFFGGIGLDVKDIISRSDLSGSKKYPASVCVNIDRAGDVRLMCDISGTENDLRNLMSQTGMAVYMKNIPNTLPYVLKIPSSEILCKGVSAFLSRMTGYSNWVLSMGILSVSQAGDLRGTYLEQLKKEQIFWLRWGIMVYEFEKEMYSNPEQDLSALWIRLVNEYLSVELGDERLGKADWAAETYFVLAPCSFHNLILGEIWASQMIHYFCCSDPRNGLESNPNFVGNERIGQHLKKYVFEQGASKTWEEVTIDATGKPLSLDAFLSQFAAGTDLSSIQETGSAREISAPEILSE